MKNKKISYLTGLIFFLACFKGIAQTFMTDPTQDVTKFVHFISVPETNPNGNQKFLFRKTFLLNEVPDSLIVHVTADQLYKLYVNDRKVGFGPAISDFYNWQYDTYNIAPLLKKGENIIAAEVFNFGELSHGRWISERIAFLLQADILHSLLLNTNKSWKSWQDKSWKALDNHMIVGPQDSIFAQNTPWGWKELSFVDGNWKQSQELWGYPSHPGLNSPMDAPWKLITRRTPFLETKNVRLQLVRRKTNATVNISDEKLSIHVPANTKAEILLDNEVLTLGFVNLITSGGKDARVKIQYAEALYDKDRVKGNRDEIKNKTMKGYYDIIIPDGGEQRRFLTSWLRTYRYVKLSIETKDEALRINDFYTEFAAYPFEHKASFETDNEPLKQIYKVGWRTARLCAIDTYTDCPYYEQLQYIGDTRIQAFISYYLTGDTRLAKNALLQFDASRRYFGLCRSSYPSTGTMVIPPFSLFWILMIDDYVLHTGDTAFIKQFVPGINAVLTWFENSLDENGLHSGLKYWNFVDWNEKYIAGVVPNSFDGVSTPVAILLSHTLERASGLMQITGYDYYRKKYSELSERMKGAIYKTCYDNEKGLFGDTPDRQLFTEHTNAWAIIAGIGSENIRNKIANVLISDDNALIGASLYGRFYVNEALRIAGVGGYAERLTLWQKMVQMGLSTFPEHPREIVRSDCHAWSASPIYELYHTVAGIQIVKNGFKEIVIQPDLEGVNDLVVKVPSPYGFIKVKYEKKKSNLNVVFFIPEKMKASFIFQEKQYMLDTGLSQLIVNIN
jgi:alpha-L-rhamnosidase